LDARCSHGQKFQGLHFLGYQQTHSLLAIISGGIISIIVVIYLLVDRNVRRAFQTGI
jgi:uncharacterized protein (DUF3084 family)